MTTKKELREKYKNYDKSLYSSILVNKLQETEEYKNAKTIMIFYPLTNEVNMLELMHDSSKQFYLPKIDRENLLCCPYKLNDKLSLSKYKTKEPCTLPCNVNNIDLIIVPALACDKKNYRLGYGGGFYDRLLKDYRGCKICCIPKELLLDTVCAEKYDIPMNFVLTD